MATERRSATSGKDAVSVVVAFRGIVFVCISSAVVGVTDAASPTILQVCRYGVRNRSTTYSHDATQR